MASPIHLSIVNFTHLVMDLILAPHLVTSSAFQILMQFLNDFVHVLKQK